MVAEKNTPKKSYNRIIFKNIMYGIKKDYYINNSPQNIIKELTIVQQEI